MTKLAYKLCHNIFKHIYFDFGLKLSPILKVNKTYGIEIRDLAQYEKNLNRETLNLLMRYKAQIPKETFLGGKGAETRHDAGSQILRDLPNLGAFRK